MLRIFLFLLCWGMVGATESSSEEAFSDPDFLRRYRGVLEDMSDENLAQQVLQQREKVDAYLQGTPFSPALLGHLADKTFVLAQYLQTRVQNLQNLIKVFHLSTDREENHLKKLQKLTGRAEHLSTLFRAYQQATSENGRGKTLQDLPSFLQFFHLLTLLKQSLQPQ